MCHFSIRSPGYFRPKVNFEYSRFKRFLFRWMPLYLRFYRWKLFYEFDRNVMSRGLGDWSTELRDTMTKVCQICTTGDAHMLKASSPRISWHT